VAFDPQLPPRLRSARFALVHRGRRLRVVLDQHGVEVAADPCATNPHVHVRVGGATAVVPGGQCSTFPTASSDEASAGGGTGERSQPDPGEQR
jgi:hypothetical protein